MAEQKAPQYRKNGHTQGQETGMVGKNGFGCSVHVRVSSWANPKMKNGFVVQEETVKASWRTMPRFATSNDIGAARR
jgi:hypothetical protein